jgi:hypothetical protein
LQRFPKNYIFRGWILNADFVVAFYSIDGLTTNSFTSSPFSLGINGSGIQELNVTSKYLVKMENTVGILLELFYLASSQCLGHLDCRAACFLEGWHIAIGFWL